MTELQVWEYVGNIPCEHSIFMAFAREMARREYGRKETRDAFFFFIAGHQAGWEAARRAWQKFGRNEDGDNVGSE